jgi:tRNA G18 (ribose-2'-O)-methylase SpoU
MVITQLSLQSKLANINTTTSTANTLTQAANQAADAKRRLIPIHNGLLQVQHTNYLSVHQSNEIIVCGFYPRASHNIIDVYSESDDDSYEQEDDRNDEGDSSMSEDDKTTKQLTTSATSTSISRPRVIDEERYNALNHALFHNYGINHTDILSTAEYEGSSVLRTYRSFVCPKPHKKNIYLLESVHKAANRTATQIELALRQHRADAATYLRNIDKEHEYINSESSAAPDDNNNNNSNNHSHRQIQPIIFILDNLRSAFNVGSIFRTCETGGVAMVVTVGITPHGANNLKLRKTAFSALDVVETLHVDNILQAYEYVKARGYTVIAMETTSKSLLYTDVTYPEKVALVVGNELTGQFSLCHDVY